MDDRIREAVSCGEGYVVGGAVRDELLHRPILDVDVACLDPEAAARSYRRAAGGSVFLLSERHGAWRVALADGLTVDFTLLRGTIREDLAGRDLTINAIASPLAGGEVVDPFGGRRDIASRVLRAVSPDTFRDDPLRLLRAVRLEDELGFRVDAMTEQLIRESSALVTEPAGERILAEVLRLSPAGYRRLSELDLLQRLGGSTERIDRLGETPDPDLLLVAALGSEVVRLPVSNETRRAAAKLVSAQLPADGSPREIHRYRRRTEPWAVEAALLSGQPELEPAIVASRAAEPEEPLLRGDELPVRPGPEVGRLLARIAEERAAGTIRTREEALELVRREKR